MSTTLAEILSTTNFVAAFEAANFGDLPAAYSNKHFEILYSSEFLGQPLTTFVPFQQTLFCCPTFAETLEYITHLAELNFSEHPDFESFAASSEFLEGYLQII